MREKMIIAVLIIGTWMTATANAGNMEVVSTHRFETGEGQRGQYLKTLTSC